MLTIYVLTFNEELILPYFINHYRTRFSDCKIVLFDNCSTDNTKKIALQNNCEFNIFDTNNKIAESEYLKIKNHCWKTSNTDWVIVCDTDEFLDIDQQTLVSESSCGTNIFKSEGWLVLNMDEHSKSIHTMKHAVRQPSLDKCILFNKNYIQEINYRPGCHVCDPIGNNISYNTNTYKLYHINFINEEMHIEKFKRNKSRLSFENLKYSYGYQYLWGEQHIRELFQKARELAQPIDLELNK